MMDKRSTRRFILYSVLTLVVFVGFEYLLHQVLLDRYRADEYSTIQVQSGTVRSTLESVLASDLLILNSVASYITVHPDLSAEQFDRYASEVYEDSTALHNLVAAPDLVIRYVYPPEGNGSILDVDYRDVPTQYPQVREAIEQETLIVAGPTETLQGGPGLLGRVPVLIGEGPERYVWGVVTTLIRMDRLLAVTDPLLEEYGLQMALRGVDGTGADGPVFYGDPALFLDRGAVHQEIMLPNGSWAMATTPVSGWTTHHPLRPLQQAGLGLVTILILLGIYAKVRSDNALTQSEQRFRDVALSTSDWIWEVDARGRYRYASGMVSRVLGYDPEELLNTSFIAYVDPAYRETVSEDIRRYTEKREAITDYETWCVTRGGERVCLLTNAIPLVDSRGTFQGYRGVHKDITAAKNLRNQLERYVAIIDRYVIISQTDLNGVITQVSDAFVRISGYTREELIGAQHKIVRHPDMPRETFAELWETIRAGKTWHGDIKNRGKNGEHFWVETDVSPMLDISGRPYGYMAVRQDITARKALEQVSVTDRLTGLNNRQKLDEVLAEEWERYKRYRENFAVIILDIDHFKPLNDTYGHMAGDTVLRRIGELLKENSRASDVVGRWGGEEFLVICPHTDVEGATALAESLRRAIESESFQVDRPVTASFGVAAVTGNGSFDSTDRLLVAADNELYRAKEGGRNRVCSAGESRT